MPAFKNTGCCVCRPHLQEDPCAGAFFGDLGRNQGLGRETVQGICAYLVVVESTVITQIGDDGILRGWTQGGRGESNLGPLFEIL